MPFVNLILVYARLEGVVLQCCFCQSIFSHGVNDVQNLSGPTIVQIYNRPLLLSCSIV